MAYFSAIQDGVSIYAHLHPSLWYLLEAALQWIHLSAQKILIFSHFRCYAWNSLLHTLHYKYPLSVYIESVIP